jgi:hypothetical protein
MICAFDIFHFLPILAIVINFILPFTRPYTAHVAFMMSLIGLGAGLHVHAGHGHALEILDPCFLYAAMLAVSSISLLKNVLQLKKSN